MKILTTSIVLIPCCVNPFVDGPWELTQGGTCWCLYADHQLHRREFAETA